MTRSGLEPFPKVPRRRGKPLDIKRLDRDAASRNRVAGEQRRLARRAAALPRNPLPGCPICGGTQLAPFLNVYGFEYAECSCCEHLFLQTPPRAEDVRRLYAGDASERGCHSQVYMDETLFARRVEMIAAPKVAFVGEILRPEGRWIDLGCATGEVLAAAAAAGWAAQGVEADEAQVEFGRRRGLSITLGYVTPEDAAGYLGEAHVVSCLNLLEHVAEPRRWLTEVVKPMARGTHVVIEVPRHPSLSSLSNAIFPDLIYRHCCAPDHLHIFSERSLEATLASAGLTPVAVWTFGQDFLELVSCAAAQKVLMPTRLWSRLLESAPRVQQALDDEGLSDALLVVSRKA